MHQTCIFIMKCLSFKPFSLHFHAYTMNLNSEVCSPASAQSGNVNAWRGLSILSATLSIQRCGLGWGVRGVKKSVFMTSGLGSCFILYLKSILTFSIRSQVLSLEEFTHRDTFTVWDILIWKSATTSIEMRWMVLCFCLVCLLDKKHCPDLFQTQWRHWIRARE